MMAVQMVALTQPCGNRSAVLCTLARRAAVKAIKRQLQAQGIPIAQLTARDIHMQADAYFQLHRQQLVEEAIEAVSKSQELRKLYEREQHQLRAKLKTNAQFANEA